ncbi:MAG: SPFH domain-containing protein [Ardenticatenaceae bacterium]|nr:SPFH domain-containing protein [Anaerolineales bacterium]MCB8923383.1 SPFH domain-containing protein [Ardenticatenaceae bacterium]
MTLRSRPPSSQTWWQATPKPGQLVPWTLALALIAYWAFAHYLERPDLTLTVQQFWQNKLPFLPLPSVFVTVAELLHPRVLRHFIPVVAGWVLARRATVSLVQILYDMPTRQAANDFLYRLQSGGQSRGKPLDITAPKLALERRKSVLLRVGGPGQIKITGSEVAVTELNGRFQRILGPGKHNLERFEIIHTILDLRQQERIVSDIPLVTKDGIAIKADVHLVFRVSGGGEPATPGTPYPYDEEAVRAAAYAQTILPDNFVAGWDTLPERMSRARLAAIIRRYRLDEILHLTHDNREPYRAIQQDLGRQLRQILRERGIELLSVVVNRLELPESVTAQYVKNWQIDWEMQRQIQEADGTAVALEELEMARAEAEMTMIQAIVEGVQRARREGHPADISEVMALRLIDALEQMAHQSQRTYGSTSPLLTQLQQIRQQLPPGLPQRSKE